MSDPVYTINTLATLRAISDPLRTAIIGELREAPRTTAQVAAALGESATKLHYHIGELERNGLIEVVETRQKGNLLERYYRSVAPFFRVDPSLFHGGPEALEAFVTNMVSTLDTTAFNLHRWARAGQLTEQEVSQSLRTLLRLRMTPELRDEFRARLEALVAEFREKSSPEGHASLSLTLLFLPLADPPDPGPDELSP